MTWEQKTIDEYLAGVSPEQRAALATLRGQIGAAAPGAEECIRKGTVRFQPECPIPASLVKKLVKTRLAENLALDRGKREKRR